MMCTAPRERIGLVANRAFREGPDGLALRFLREFEPYIRDVLQPELYVLEGTYRALQRHGVLADYPHLYPLPSGREGGLVALTDMVVSSPEAGSGREKNLDVVVYLIDPRDPTSLFPESHALKRECVVTGTTFLATFGSATEWYALQWCANLQGDDATEASVRRYFLPRGLAGKVLPGLANGVADDAIALIAHDAKKTEMLRFAADHFQFLSVFRERLATGTTGTLLNGRVPARIENAWNELSEEVRAFEAIGSVPPSLRRLEAARADMESALSKLSASLSGGTWVRAQPSGPRGGDIQIGEVVRRQECHKVLFFEDPHVSREHEADIQLLERMTRIPGHEVTCLHDAGSAGRWATQWAACMGDGRPAPINVFDAFRALWNVDLIPVDVAPPEGTEGGAWSRILDKAAWYLVGLVHGRARARLQEGEPLRMAVTWGYEMHELADAMDAVRNRILASAPPGRGISRPLLEEFPAGGAHMVAGPTVGIIGTTDPRNEANHNAGRFGEMFGGRTLTLPHFAFYEEAYGREARLAADEALTAHWDHLDIAVATCDELSTRFGAGSGVPWPPALLEEMRPDSVGEFGGMYLTASGGEALSGAYLRIGMNRRQFARVARSGGSVLLAGAQARRLGPALAALRGGLVSALVTDLDFAWGLLRAHAGDDAAGAGERAA